MTDNDACDPLGDVRDAEGSNWDAFEFGEPESVLSRGQLIDMMEVQRAGNWFEPPVSREGLSRAFYSSPHHSSAIDLKCNQLVADFIETDYLSTETFEKICFDLMVYGDLYVEERRNNRGKLLFLDHCLAKYTRRGIEEGVFWDVPYVSAAKPYDPFTVHQLSFYDGSQEIYGTPKYLAALQSAFLNEAATLFRRRYYKNGSHAGYIMYATGDFADGDTEKMRNALKRSKGPGNFRNLFVHAPKGTENGIKIVPIATVGAADEFLGIKGTTRDDILAAHRVPPQLLGIVPAQGSSGFGNPLQAFDLFYLAEINSLRTKLLGLNKRVGVEAVRFKPRELVSQQPKVKAA